MSADLYHTRLCWDGRRGIAKMGGVQVELKTAPPMPLVPHMAEIDYAPQVHVAQLRESAGAWRDMTAKEIEAAMALLGDVAIAARTPLAVGSATTPGESR
jgi:hypothetical protein